MVAAEAELPSDLRARLSEFTGRRWVFDKVGSWLRGTERRFLLTGPPGTGKSMIAARIVEISSGDFYEPGLPDLPRAVTYAHFCQARRPWTQNPLTFIEAISEHLAGLHEGFRAALLQTERQEIVVHGQATAGTAAPGAVVAGVNLSVNIHNQSAVLAFDELIRKPLSALGPGGIGYPIVILVDGLDEALGIGEGKMVELLAAILHPKAGLPPLMRFLLTARSDEPRILDRFGLPDLDLQADIPLESNDVGIYVRGKLVSHPEAVLATVATQVAERSHGNFLYARYVLEDLLKEPEQLENAAALSLPSDLKEVYREFISREIAQTRRDEAWRSRYRPILGLLAVSRDEGLTPRQMTGATERLTGERIRSSEVIDALESCVQFLAGSLPQGPVRIYHESFREFLLTEPALSIDQTSITQALAEYFIDEHEDAWEQCDDDYALLHTPSHLVEAALGSPRRADRARLLQQLTNLLTDYDFIRRKLNRFGIRAVLDDFNLVADEPLSVQHEDLDWLRKLQRALQLSARALSDHPEQLFSQLIGRLADHEPGSPADHLLGQAMAEHTTRRLIPEFSSLQAPGGPLLQVLQHGQPSALAIAPDGSRAVSGSQDGSVMVWDLVTYQPVGPVLDHGSAVTTVAISPDTRYAVSGSGDGVVKIWQVDHAQPTVTVLLHEDPIAAATVSEDGLRVACVLQGGANARLWRLENGEALGEVTFGKGAAGRLAAAGDALRIVSATIAGGLVVTEPAGHGNPRVLLERGDVTAVAITQDGSCALSLSFGGKLGIWDLQGNRSRMLDTDADAVEVKKGGGIYRTGGGSPYVGGLAVAADARRAISGYMDGLLRIWELDVNEQRTLQHGDPIAAVSMTQDGGRAVSAGRDGTLKVWDLRRVVERDVKRLSAEVSAVAITRDGRRVVAGSQDGRLALWDRTDQWRPRTLQSSGFHLTGVTISPDAGSAICVSWEGSVTRWDLEGTRPVQVLGELGQTNVPGITPDGRLVLSDGGGGLVMHDLGNQTRQVLRRGASVTATAVTPDGLHAISALASPDGQLELWSLDRRHLRMTLRHGSPVSAVAVTADFNWALSGSYHDYAVKLWDLNRGEEIALLPHSAPVTAVAATPDRKWALSGTANGTLTLWDLSSASVKSTATFTADSRISACAIAATPDVTVAAGDSGGAVHVLQLHLSFRMPAYRTSSPVTARPDQHPLDFRHPSKTVKICEGTNQIQRMVIRRDLARS
jgi:WD40 repeat protein